MLFQKFKASGFHLLISFIILLLLFGTLIFIWFPEPYFTATGGWQGLKIVALVDLVLGPALTFVIFNLSKPKSELIRDIGIIATLQILALVWGINTIYTQRPMAIVFWESTFKTVVATDLHSRYEDTQNYQDIINAPRHFYVAKKPKSVNNINLMIERLNTFRIGPHHQLELYEKLSDSNIDLNKFNLDINEIITKNKSMKAKLNEILATNSAHIDDYIYLQLESKYQNIVMIFNQENQFINYIKAPLKSKNEI